MATTSDATDVSELVMLIANNTDRVIAFKNLNVETLDQPTQLPESAEKVDMGNELLIPNAVLPLVLAVFIAAGLNLKKRKFKG